MVSARTPVDLPHHYQETEYTCGPAAMKMALEAIQGARVQEETLARQMDTDDFIGTRQRVLVSFARRAGLEVVERHTDASLHELRSLMRSGHVVMVCYWIRGEATDHYALVHSIDADHILLHDPWLGPETSLTLDEFLKDWRGDPGVPARRDRWLMALRVPAPAAGDAPVRRRGES